MAVLRGFVGSTTVSGEAAPPRNPQSPIPNPPRARLYYLARPTKTAMLRRLVCAVCPSNPKGSPGRRFEILNKESS